VSDSVQLTVDVDFYQYYIYGATDFDSASVDALNDGILAPRGCGTRVNSGAHLGKVDVAIRVFDEPIALPTRPDAVASACNLEVPSGVVIVDHWGGPAAFQHDFGRPLTCGLLVEVYGRDEANAHNYQPEPGPREHHDITISSVPFVFDRWRSTAIDQVGTSLASYFDHIDRG